MNINESFNNSIPQIGTCDDGSYTVRHVYAEKYRSPSEVILRSDFNKAHAMYKMEAKIFKEALRRTDSGRYSTTDSERMALIYAIKLAKANAIYLEIKFASF